MSDPFLGQLASRFGNKKTGEKSEPVKEKRKEKSLGQIKTQEEIRKLQIDNETKLRNLVEKKMVQAILGKISFSIKTNFVDTPKREAHDFAARLGIPEREHDVEILLADIIENGLNSTISEIETMIRDETFE